MRKKTHEEFIKEIEELPEIEEYQFLEEYDGAHKKIEVIHHECNNKYKVTPNKFKQGRRCPECAGTRKKTNEEFLAEISGLPRREEYTFLEPYQTNNRHVKVVHKCGYEYEVTPIKFLRGARCPKCAGTLLKTTEEFKKEVQELGYNRYELVSEYTNDGTKVEILHHDCGRKYKVTPSGFISGNRCSKCHKDNMRKTKSKEEFAKDFEALEGEEYTLLSDYKRNDKKVLVRHDVCGREYKVTPNKFYQGRRCPHCRASKGEVYVRRILDGNSIDYEYQKGFEELRYENPLTYDFYIPKKKIAIEYQGKQHYEPIEHFGGMEEYLLQVERDKVKRIFAKDNNITLIEVPYTLDKKEILELLKTQVVT